GRLCCRRSEFVFEHAGRVDRSLRNRVPLQLSILGIAPGSLKSFALLRADGERLKAELIVDRSVDQDVVASFVGNQPIEFRIEEDRVADVVAAQMRIEMDVQ